jgi:hypothetical protein
MHALVQFEISGNRFSKKPNTGIYITLYISNEKKTYILTSGGKTCDTGKQNARQNKQTYDRKSN